MASESSEGSEERNVEYPWSYDRSIFDPIGYVEETWSRKGVCTSTVKLHRRKAPIDKNEYIAIVPWPLGIPLLPWDKPRPWRILAIAQLTKKSNINTSHVMVIKSFQTKGSKESLKYKEGKLYNVDNKRVALIDPLYLDSIKESLKF